jgi:cytochrome c oxidase cbb3-type subunit IV
MNFDINVVRGVLTLLLLVTFIGLCFWAYSRKRESAFNEAANLPFADEELNARSGAAANSRKNGEPS